MDELQLTLKVEANTQAITDVQAQLDKLKTSTNENAEGFGIMDTKIGGMWKTLTEGVSKGVASMKTFAGAVAATGIGLLVIAVAELYNWFHKTEEGSNVLKKIMAELGMVMRDGPLFVINALKIPLDVIVGYFKILYSIITNLIGVITGKTGLAEAVKNVAQSFKEQAEHVKKDVENLKDLAKTEAQRAIDTAKIADMEAALRKQKRLDEVELAKLEADAIHQRMKATEANVTAAEKVKLLNIAKEDQNKIYQIHKKDAEEELAIAQLTIKAGDQSAEAQEKLAAATAKLSQVEADHDRSFMQINRRQTGAANADAKLKAEAIKQAEKDADELAKINEKTLEDSLKGRQKELAAAEFSYNEEVKKNKGKNEILLALLKQHYADVQRINEKFDKEDQKTKEEKAKREFEAEQKKWAEIDKAQEEHTNTLLKINEEDHKNRRISDEKYLKDKYTLEVMLAKGNAAKIKLIDEQIADEKKKLHKLEVKNTLDALQQTLDMVSEAAGKGTIVGKAAAIASIGINTAKGIMAAWATSEELGPILGPILAGVQTAALIVMGAKQAAEIAKQKEPTKQKLASGGWIGGNSMQGDNIPVMANTGEYMIGGQAMKNPQIAQAVMNMNANPNGYQGQSQSISESRIAEIAAGVVKSIPVQVSEHFVTLAQRNVQYRENRFTVQ